MFRSRSFGLDRFSGLYLWALFIIMFAIWQPSLFPTAATAHIIASGQAVEAMIALGVLVPLIAGAYDLSVGAVANLTAVIVVNLQVSDHWAVAPAIVAGVLCGVVVGAVNGLFVVKLKINSFIATLASGSIVVALETIVSGNNQPLPPSNSTWLNITQTTVFGFQIVFVYLIVLAIILWWVLEHTPVGRYLYATGSNAEAARLSGVRTDKWTWMSLVVSGTVAGLAGVLYASTVGSPSLTFGPALLLPAFAAAFLGFTQIKPGRFNVWGSVIAIYVLATGVQGFEYVTSVQWLSDMFNGVALVIAVTFAVWRQQRSSVRPAAGLRKGARPPRGDADDTGDSVSGPAG